MRASWAERVRGTGTATGPLLQHPQVEMERAARSIPPLASIFGTITGSTNGYVVLNAEDAPSPRRAAVRAVTGAIIRESKQVAFAIVRTANSGFLALWSSRVPRRCHAHYPGRLCTPGSTAREQCSRARRRRPGQRRRERRAYREW